ncbi:hypothetical protein PFISCL1PPCAC_13109, partial [Pristionchus fissidentatus]
SQVPDLEWLVKRGGTIFMFGPPGKTEFFRYEMYILLTSIAIIAPFLSGAIFHSLWMLRNQKLIGINICYIIPLSIVVVHMMVDVSILPAPLLVFIRCLFMIVFVLESTQLSLVFLLKSPIHRHICSAFHSVMVALMQINLRCLCTPYSFCRMLLPICLFCLAVCQLSSAVETVAVRGVLTCGKDALAETEIKLFDNHR